MKAGQLFKPQIRLCVLGNASRYSKPLQLPQIPWLQWYNWDKVVRVKNSSYKNRSSRGADAAGLVVRSAPEHPRGRNGV